MAARHAMLAHALMDIAARGSRGRDRLGSSWSGSGSSRSDRPSRPAVRGSPLARTPSASCDALRLAQLGFSLGDLGLEGGGGLAPSRGQRAVERLLEARPAWPASLRRQPRLPGTPLRRRRDGRLARQAAMVCFGHHEGRHRSSPAWRAGRRSPSAPSGEPCTFSVPALVGAPKPMMVRQAIRDGRSEVLGGGDGRGHGFGLVAVDAAGVPARGLETRPAGRRWWRARYRRRC